MMRIFDINSEGCWEGWEGGTKRRRKARQI